MLQLGIIVRKMHLEFQLNPLNGSGVVAIINFELNQLSCLAADPWKLDKQYKTNHTQVHTLKISV